MEAILAAVDELEDELVTLLQRLIRIPTVNPPGEAYEDFVAAFKAVLDELGYATEVHRAPPELAPLGEGLPRPNLLARLPGDGPRVHLNGHYDVVPVGNDWTRDPFGGELADGHVYGRGAADMKSGLAAQVIAVEALHRAGLKPNVVQSAVPDEETVGVRNAGMGFLVEQGLLEGDAVIITEPFGPDGVGIGHKGAIWGEITIFGKQAHGSAPQLGENAVEAMARYLATLDRELRPKLETRITDYGVTPDNRRSTLSFDTIRGGHATNIVPDRCTVTFNRRLIPGEDLDAARRELLAPLDGVRHSYHELYSTQPTLVGEDEPVVQAAQRALRALGLTPRILISAGSDDQRFVVHNAGITNSLVYGPGQTGLSHVADERISVADLVLGTKGLALIIAELMS
ncbi:M20 family metallopeptidase [Solirubrobacter sp. CPCC 204708]|uniref:M20 family metallopeptidase n=1 Tax=Solirubrobacter deserti TaxID=2282478 RepID=A0ABT4RV63_9ACTN|nr:M20 family metallopeptidase [Solirubrobacter deserti]MBE2316460.1 M20 family metallopeptidase [Solirubrobacter deserti]MDA0142150.1 M20 family metallopeptidase [Solirubrobacter deserti]